MELPETLNIEFLDEQYKQWKSDPASVSKEWRIFFEGFEIGMSGEKNDRGAVVSECSQEETLRQSRVEALKYRYRDLGHLLACLDPLSACPTDHPLLNISAFGLTPEDLDRTFFTRRFSEGEYAKLSDIVQYLKQTYCRSVGVEYMHLQDPEERRWLQDHMEPNQNRPDFSREEKIWILNKLVQAAEFETFLNRKYTGQTRFSLEGAESIVPMMNLMCAYASEKGSREVILGMAHRGRLNVLTNVLYKPYEEVFREFINSYNPDSVFGSGDVKYHNGFLTDIRLPTGKMLRVFLVNNPSHLESVNPVVEGVAKARQEVLGSGDETSVLPVLIHGDAAFSGQGVVMETLNLSQLEGYRTGGTVHIVINNQIGYTTLPENARSTRYSTDVAKMLMSPVFHVHGENPEAVCYVIKLAADYRYTFGKDVVIDVVCYRRFGHNEGDEPYFTQPLMYDRIRERPPVFKLYARELIDEGLITEDEPKRIQEDVRACLAEAFQAASANPSRVPEDKFYEVWDNFNNGFSKDPPDTRIDMSSLLRSAEQLSRTPEDFHVHPKLERLLDNRRKSIQKDSGIDWANAEALAFATLLDEGVSIRLSGQDCGRGTFSQRHAVLFDTKTGSSFVPLTNSEKDGAKFTVLNSSLSEYGVLGFEYGYSLVRPENLVLWEAQFGDFANNAQGIIDLYIASGETKWRRNSGLVMLLPHGWEGLGPEHSSARLERFLQLCAENNMIVVNPTTPAQYFHLLRGQVKASYRKPLVVMTPKSLLRNPAARSKLAEFSSGSFLPVIDYENGGASVTRVLFCSGKIFYELEKRKELLERSDIAIIRIERLYPFPSEHLNPLTKKYATAKEWFWVQEEPENMGAWSFVRPLIEEMIQKKPGFIGRKASPSPATGYANIYRQEQSSITDRAVGPAPGQQIIS